MTPFQTLLQEQQKDRARPPTTTTVSMPRHLSKEEEGTHKSTPSPQAHHHHHNNNQILHALSSSSSSSSSTLEESEYHALSSPTVIDTPLLFQYSSSNTSPTMTPDEHYPSSETSTHLHPYSNNNNESTTTSNHNNNHNNTPNNNNNYNYPNNNNSSSNNNNSSSSSSNNNNTETRSFMILANDLDRSPRIAPPPIRTKWSDDLKKREYPLTFSSSTQSSKSDRPSPSTPRSLLPPLDPSLLPSSASLHPPHRSYFAGPFDSPSKASFHRHHILPTPMYFSESPMEYRSTPLVTPPLAPPPQLQPPQQQPQPQPQHYHQYQHYNHRLHEQPYLEEHDMEHCSEQDDVREREYGEDDEDEDDDDKELELRRQQHRLAQQHQHQQQQQLRYPTPNEQVQHHGEEEEEEDAEEDARSKQAKKKRPNARTHHSQSSVSSVVSDLALGVPTLRQEGKEDVKGSLSKASPSPSSRQVSTKAKGSTSVQGTENVLDQIEDDNQGHDGSGVHSQAGRGLRFYSQRVCDRVQAKGATTYNELVHELSGGQPGEYVEDAVGQEPSGQENIRRRVYDALNVLEALDIISMDKKEIQWIGVENSRVLNETTRKVGTASHGNNHRRELDEESEEPEDDDMDIEQLQREVDALKLRNELERAQLQDQVSRHVQLNNLVARNKLREAKEQERHERRKQRKLKREEERARGNADANDECNPDHMEPTTSEEKKKKSERRHRHRSPRHRENEVGEQGEEDEEEDMEEGEDPGETKEERRARKQARRERREKRALRREQRDSGIMLTEEEKIQMPFVVVRIPRYGHQSSDSEANISVVRRSRESRSKKSGKTKRQEDTTTVEIQIPHQEELCIISDTEILGDLGLGTVSLNDLKTMLPKDLLGNARYVTNPGNVTVHGGFERVVCSH